jgi:hypothetical protein
MTDFKLVKMYKCVSCGEIIDEDSICLHECKTIKENKLK